MSEPITLYCTKYHQYGGRGFVPGNEVVLTAPSTVREFVASGNWSYTPPEEPQEAPPVEVQMTPPAEERVMPYEGWQQPVAKPKPGKKWPESLKGIAE